MKQVSLLLAVVPLLATLPGAAAAQTIASAPRIENAKAATASLPDDQKADPFAAAAIDDTALQSIAGREDTNQASYADQVAGVSKNSIGDNSVTGDAKISDNAFQNLSGLSILNVNTGNNVAINAAMNVNISITPGQ